MINVRDYGATGDGKTLDTGAIQSALNICGEHGGEVVVPPGTYLCGTLFVQSHTILTLSSGATLLASMRPEDYMDSAAEEDLSSLNLVRVDGAEGVVIRGPGMIEGQGSAHWDTPEAPLGGQQPWRGYPLPLADHPRPQPLIAVRDSEDIHIESIALRNAAGRNLDVSHARHVWIDGLRITSSMVGPDTSGITVVSSGDVSISHCHIESGDDAIALYASPEWGPTERVTIDQCVLTARACAIKVLGLPDSVFHQITATGVTVHNSERAVGIYLHGGAVGEDFAFANFVIATGVTPPNIHERPLHIDVRPLMRDDEGSGGVASDRPSRLSGVSFTDMIIRSRGRILLAAAPSEPIVGLCLSDITLLVTGSQDLEAFRNPPSGLAHHNRTLPHIRTAPAHIVLHGVASATVDHVQVVAYTTEPLQGMHGAWLEQAIDTEIVGLTTYRLREGYERVLRR